MVYFRLWTNKALIGAQDNDVIKFWKSLPQSSLPGGLIRFSQPLITLWLFEAGGVPGVSLATISKTRIQAHVMDLEGDPRKHLHGSGEVRQGRKTLESSKEHITTVAT